jgi:hypothetical protein
MSDPQKALATQLENLQKRTGKSLDELAAIIAKSGLSKHGEVVAMLKRDLGMGHGDANTLVHTLKSRGGAGAGAGGGAGAAGVGGAAGAASGAGAAAAATKGAAAAAAAGTAGGELDAIYAGPKAALLPVHQAVMRGIERFGAFEIAPKKTYLSLRRKKQFATVGPATKTQVEVGLNMKGVAATDRLQQLPPGGMCQYRVRLGSVDEVDADLLGWIRTAYDAAG